MNALRAVLLALVALLGMSAAGAIGTDEETRFGVVEGFWFPELTCGLGAGWERIIFNWEQHQPTGPDDWHTLNVDDRWLKAANGCGREVVALLKHTPEWATDGIAGAGVPRGLHLPVDDVDNLWANFVRQAAAYYAPRGVHRFIIWNEPDIARETYGFEFEGDLEDYFRLVQVAYLAAKQGNPAAEIHLAGTTYWHDVNEGERLYMDRLLERITVEPDAAVHGYYFDAFSLHIYFRTDTVYDIVQQTRALLDGYGLRDKVIWINETNAAPTDDPDWPVQRPVFQLDLTQQASFLMQAAGLALAAGVERVAVYKLYDQELPPGGESFGILSPADQSPRPAFATWATVIDQLSDVEAARRAAVRRVDAVHFTHRDGLRESLLLWARTDAPATVRVTATADKAHWIDQYGGVALLRPVDGFYTLHLPGARCNPVDGCAVGGPAWLLVQPPGEISVQVVGETRPLSFGEE